MAALAKLRQQVPGLVADYFQRTRDADAVRARDVTAVTKIQAAARGFIVRRRIWRMMLVATTIQRFWRGYAGRLRAKLALELHNKQLRQLYFNAQATIIQKHWRSFWSRKHVFDFHARKAYLAATHAHNQATRQYLSEEAERAVATQRQMAETAARKLFDEKISKLHHLTSTATQPGIFNSPYSVATGQLPLVAGMPVEEHLKASIKAQLKLRLPPLSKDNSPKHTTTLSSGGSPIGSPHATAKLITGNRRTISVVAPAYKKLTLRQTADYQAVHAAALLEEKIHRGEMLTKHPLPFDNTAHGASGPLFNTQSNRNLVTYNDPYDPTLGLRNERFTAEQRAISPFPFTKYIKSQAYFDDTEMEQQPTY